MYNPFFLELFTFRRFLLYIYYRMDTLSVKSEYKYSCAKCIDNTKNVCNYNKTYDYFQG